jgi:hypothetical protein
MGRLLWGRKESGTPATAGVYVITIKAQNGVGSVASQKLYADGEATPWLTETGALPSGVAIVDNQNRRATLGGDRRRGRLWLRVRTPTRNR